MEIKGLGQFSLLEANNVQTKKVLAKDVIPELKDVEVKVDISKEGMEALRMQVQEMPGRIDVEEMMRDREILPKLQMDPVGTHYFQMAKYEGEFLEKVKEVKGNAYTIEDIRDVQLKAYNRCYKELEEAYEKGERDIYICNGVVDGKAQYHQVTKEEDFSYLKEAFERLDRKATLYQQLQERNKQIQIDFSGNII